LQGGYRYISVDGRNVAEHRYVAECRAGRRLGFNEVVHHVDGDQLNNAPENLVVLSRSEHQRLHAVESKRRWSAEEKSRAQELRQSGLTTQEVATALGRCFSSTWRYVKAAATPTLREKGGMSLE
jgi:hypothetical protein